MTRYLVGRVLAGVVSLLLFVTALFIAAEWVIPGRGGGGPSLWEQYKGYLGGVLSGDFLHSAAIETLPWTLLVFVIALGIAFPVGHWLGKVAGWKYGAAGSTPLTIASVLLYTVFPPLLVFALIMGLSRFTDDQGVGMLRTMFNEGSLDTDVGWSMLRTIAVVALLVAIGAAGAAWSQRRFPTAFWVLLMTAAPVLIWVEEGSWSAAAGVLRYLALPIAAVAILAVGEVILVSKSTTAEAAHEDFVFTARAKGVPDRRVRDTHVGRFTLVPILSKLVVSIPFILVGLMIVEISFGWAKFGFGCEQQTGGCLFDPNGNQMGTLGYYVPGMSSTLFTSLERGDTLTVIDGLIIVGLIVLACRLALDVAHALLDPRIRVGTRVR